MSKLENTYIATLAAAGATETIPITEKFSRYVYSGSGALVGNITISTSGTPKVGTTIHINWNCTFTAGGATVTLFGVAIPAQMYGKSFIFEAIYNGSTWDNNIIPNFKETKFIDLTQIVDATLTGAKVAASTINISNLTSNANLQSTIVEVSFETGEQVNNTIKIPTAFTLNSIYYEVIKALSNTDAGTITPKINGVAVTLSAAISIPLSTAINTTGETTCTALNTGVAGDLVSFVAAKTTVGGKVRLTLNWSKA